MLILVALSTSNHYHASTLIKQKVGWIVIFSHDGLKNWTEGRKITMIVDNCPAHPHVEGLQAVELIFLPPNTTSKLQPNGPGSD